MQSAHFESLNIGPTVERYQTISYKASILKIYLHLIGRWFMRAGPPLMVSILACLLLEG